MLGGASGRFDRNAETAAKGDRIMTVVGKILVFLNLVFSLVVGAFAVMDYTARTHWVDGYKTLESRYIVLQGVTGTYKNEADRLAKEKDDLNERLNKSGVKGLETGNKEESLTVATRTIAMLNDQAKTIDRMRAEYDDLKKVADAAKGNVVKYSTMELTMKADVQRRQEDSGILRQHLKEETDKNFELTKNTNLMRDDMIQAQIRANTFKSRNEELEAQMRKNIAELAALKAGGAGAAGAARGGANPPPDNLEGVVRSADGNLVTISLGSDAGLSKGNTLEVFRLKGSLYIGKIRIVEVAPGYAIATAVGRMSRPIQVDDRVASRILTSP